MEPVIQEFLSENPEIVYIKIDVDQDSATAQKHGVMGIPTFISVDGENVVARAKGAIPKEELQSLFK
jgi:thioredoxin 1